MSLSDLFDQVDPSFVHGVVFGIAVGVPVTVISRIIFSFLRGFWANFPSGAKSILLSIGVKLKRLLASNRSSEIRLANPENVDPERVWFRSKPIILRKMKEELGYGYFSDQEIQKVAKKLGKLDGIPLNRLPDDVIFPLVLEKALDEVSVFMETEPQGLVIIKLVVPRIFRVTRSRTTCNRLRMVCKPVMQQFIDGKFELVLEDFVTHMLRIYMQETGLLLLED